MSEYLKVMSFLPIVHRELRVASQKRSTYHLRAWTVAIMLLFFSYLYFFSYTGNFNSSRLGSNILTLLSSLLFTYCILAGVFYTADCIGKEKRDGTIGLLFLTKLRGYDVTAGKLAANSLNSFYALVAATPVLASSMLFGGVTSQQFYCTVLGLVACMFLSLSVGLLASSLISDAKMSMSLTVLILMILSFGFPLIDQIVTSTFNLITLQKLFTFASPLYLLQFGWSGFGFLPFWSSFWTHISIGFGCFVLSSILTSRWRPYETNTPSTQFWRTILTRPFTFSPRPLQRGRSIPKNILRPLRYYEGNPFTWLAHRDISSNRYLWILFGLCGVGFFWTIVQPTIMFIAIGLYSLYPVHVLFKILTAVEACRRFHDDAESGALELLTVTPQPIQSLPSAYFTGQEKQNRNMIRFVIVLNFMVLGGFYSHMFRTSVSGGDELIILWLVIVGGSVIMVFDQKALVWTGLAFGLKEKKLNRAIFKTLLRVMSLPWVGLMLIIAVIMGGNFNSEGLMTFMIIVWLAASAILDLHVIRKNKTMLQTRFRELLHQ
jgi:ABC-type transport system involved in multi-copper enzyme maturation permease subunit